MVQNTSHAKWGGWKTIAHVQTAEIHYSLTGPVCFHFSARLFSTVLSIVPRAPLWLFTSPVPLLTVQGSGEKDMASLYLLQTQPGIVDKISQSVPPFIWKIDLKCMGNSSFSLHCCFLSAPWWAHGRLQLHGRLLHLHLMYMFDCILFSREAGLVEVYFLHLDLTACRFYYSFCVSTYSMRMIVLSFLKVTLQGLLS